MKRGLLVLLIFLIGCAQQPAEPIVETPTEGFCGISTNGACTSAADCTTDGCSGQICRSAAEEGIVTTCEYLDCYDESAYGLSCGCVEGQCQWA